MPAIPTMGSRLMYAPRSVNTSAANKPKGYANGRNCRALKPVVALQAVLALPNNEFGVD